MYIFCHWPHIKYFYWLSTGQSTTLNPTANCMGWPPGGAQPCCQFLPVVTYGTATINPLQPMKHFPHFPHRSKILLLTLQSPILVRRYLYKCLIKPCVYFKTAGYDTANLSPWSVTVLQQKILVTQNPLSVTVSWNHACRKRADAAPILSLATNFPGGHSQYCKKKIQKEIVP